MRGWCEGRVPQGCPHKTPSAPERREHRESVLTLPTSAQHGDTEVNKTREAAAGTGRPIPSAEGGAAETHTWQKRARPFVYSKAAQLFVGSFLAEGQISTREEFSWP